MGVTWPQRPVLPPPQLNPPAQELLSDAGAVFVRAYDFTGNTVFSDEELRAVTARFAGRKVNSDELEEARRALTLHYVEHGYINSGAVLEDQTLTNGVVMFTLVEGRLTDVALEGNRRLRSNFIRRRLQRYAGPPVNMARLQEGLFELKDNPNVKHVNAELKPGAIPGTSLLEVRMEEANPWHLGLEIRNDRPPSVGAEVLETRASHSDLTGNSDELAIRYAIAHRQQSRVKFSGLDDWGASYTVPLFPSGTTLRLFYDRNDFSVLEEPFNDFDIRSEAISYGFSVRQPVWKRFHREIALGVIAERRESRTFLLGEPFSFSPGAVNGRSAETVLRFFQEWIERSQFQVLALRSTFSWGLDLFNATRSGAEPDATYLSWLGQAQYVRRIGHTQNQLVLSTIAQLANDPLLSMEQFSLGGANTVRGYRENQLVRDMAVVSSVELRVPILTTATGASLLEWAPFFDYGIGWNVRGRTPQPSDLSSAGVGLIVTPHRRVQGRIYWGYAFREFDTGNDDLQDHGIHFKLNVSID